MIDYTVKHNLPVAASAKKPYSMDDNLLHISYEAGILEDPNFLLEKDNFLRTTDPSKAPDKAERVKITFEKGNPVAVDGKTLAPAALLDALNVIAGKHGIGRVDMVESRYVGMKSRGVYETPGGTLLYFAHRDLEGMALTGQVIADKEMLMPLWAQRVYQGYWFDPSMRYLTDYFKATQECVSGSITVELYKGNMTVVGRECPMSLYDMNIASMDSHKKNLYDQSDASGFIRLHGLPLRLDAKRRGKK
jgi:argininosuccinate synthase